MVPAGGPAGVGAGVSSGSSAMAARLGATRVSGRLDVARALTAADRRGFGGVRPTGSGEASFGVVAARTPVPHLKHERAWMTEGQAFVVGVDEVGRGALSGPVTVGVVAVDGSTGRQPNGLRDSKLLTAEEREALAPRIRRWALAWGVGHGTSEEIDEFGILVALRLAGERALAAAGVRPGITILDGNYDWLTRPPRPLVADAPPVDGRVQLMIKGDMKCSSIAAASILAKVERDGLMREMSDSFPEYCWHENKGYATPVHLDALRRLGPCAYHRRSWNLPLAGEELAEAELVLAAG